MAGASGIREPRFQLGALVSSSRTSTGSRSTRRSRSSSSRTTAVALRAERGALALASALSPVCTSIGPTGPKACWRACSPTYATPANTSGHLLRLARVSAVLRALAGRHRAPRRWRRHCSSPRFWSAFAVRARRHASAQMEHRRARGVCRPRGRLRPHDARRPAARVDVRDRRRRCDRDRGRVRAARAGDADAAGGARAHCERRPRGRLCVRAARRRAHARGCSSPSLRATPRPAWRFTPAGATSHRCSGSPRSHSPSPPRSGSSTARGSCSRGRSWRGPLALLARFEERLELGALAYLGAALVHTPRLRGAARGRLRRAPPSRLGRPGGAARRRVRSRSPRRRTRGCAGCAARSASTRRRSRSWRPPRTSAAESTRVPARAHRGERACGRRRARATRRRPEAQPRASRRRVRALRDQPREALPLRPRVPQLRHARLLVRRRGHADPGRRVLLSAAAT